MAAPPPFTPLVSFVIAGVQKGGTTALFDYLADYPDIALPDAKELHFFDDESRNWSRPDYADYHARFADPAGRPCGEATPIYAYWPNSLERIAAYNPAMKLVMVLRDPVQRAWSHWRMEYARGVETHPFAWCIRQGRQRLFDADPWGVHRELSYVERGFYGEQMERLYGLFPRAQVLVLTSDALRADPGPALAQVRALLGLPPAAAPLGRDVHVGREMAYPSDLTTTDIDHLRQVYAADADRLAALTGVRFG
ncbi:MAG: sulfotransferase domain-containing protein [Alphaproteobacteria bacterium]|nr:sulfotransferase domain-containing protein [Alphaproteobacteria bacterium]MBU1514475.1 sulfotransferase domain-containing protein [Alphaproteobacteria bacterium]MBU2096893.1 sulfotransferase domain-containing protein [Alphaproteobacteria bacterium]MBU2153520.1 sulfotransferase domain-containing protein [Alphaproteobacteria bacterium]MBU2305975.1 sulfotransferase domain-containing protein [Alphaproteobacteria bacterium]